MLKTKTTTAQRKKRRHRNRQRESDAAFVLARNRLLAGDLQCTAVETKVPGLNIPENYVRCRVRVNSMTATMVRGKDGLRLVCGRHRP